MRLALMWHMHACLHALFLCMRTGLHDALAVARAGAITDLALRPVMEAAETAGAATRSPSAITAAMMRGGSAGSAREGLPMAGEYGMGLHQGCISKCPSSLRMYLQVNAATHRMQLKSPTTCCCHAVNTTGGWTWDQGAQPAGRQVRIRGMWGVVTQMCT